MNIAAFRLLPAAIVLLCVLASGCAATAGQQPDSGHGLVTPYTITLRRFSNSEALTVMGVMADEFPGYHSHNLMKKASGLRRYEYRSSAGAYKLEEWLYVLFTDMGFDADSELEIYVGGNSVIIDKLVPVSADTMPSTNSGRFN